MAPIYIANHSFENPSLAGAPEYWTTGIVPDWHIDNPEDESGAPGILRPPSTALLPTDGAQTAYLNGSPISQTLSATLQGNTTYTLQADFLSRIEPAISWPGCALDLLAGGQQVASEGIPSGHGLEGLPPGTVRTVTVIAMVAADHPLIGWPIGIRIRNLAGGAQVNVDNVRIDASPTAPSGPEITAVERPQSGNASAQSITITGSNFPTPPTVTITDPQSQPVSVTVTSSSTTSIVVSGVFYAEGTYTVQVDNSAPFPVDALPPILPSPTITDVTRPQSGIETDQSLTITGTDFPDPPDVTVLDPSETPVDISVISASSTEIEIEGVFADEGTYTVTVDGSEPFPVDALPPPGTVPTITSVTRPRAVQGSQSVTITGLDFPDLPDVTITGPDTQPIALSVISATATSITVTGIFPLAGTYRVVVSGSEPYAVDSAPPSIASVLPPLISGWISDQPITIIGSGFHPDPQVRLFNPDGTSRTITVTSSSANAILAWIPFHEPGPPGTYTLTVDDSAPFDLVSVPRPVITSIDPIYQGIPETQDLTIHGTGFLPGQLVQIRDSQNQLINVRILSVTPTAITVRGFFFQPGDYTFTVGVADPVTQSSVAKPATIISTGPIYDDRSPIGTVGGALTIGGYGFTASQGPGYPPYPVVTITDPNGQAVAFDFTRSQDTWVLISLHPPLVPGEYTITVDGSPPWRQQSIPYIGYTPVTGVDPAPQAGTYDDQYLTLTGENFPTDVPPSVIVSDPAYQGVTVTVIPPWTSTSVTIRGVFYTNGYWGFRIGQSQIFEIHSIPPVGPVATILAVTRPATGLATEQYLTIQGTLFETPPHIQIRNPSGQLVPFTLLYGSSTAAVVSGIFNQAGTWTVTVDNGSPFTVDALPEPATITGIQRPQAGLATSQTIQIDGSGFTGDVVSVTGPSGQPISTSIVSSTATSITVTLADTDLPEGVYTVSADYSPDWSVLALPIPAPTLTAATAIQSGLTATQSVTLTGTWMRPPVSMTVAGPHGNVPVTVTASSREQVTVEGVFLYPGSYTFTVTADGRPSLPFTTPALPPAPPVITAAAPRPQAGLTASQTLTLQTTGFLTGPLVTVTGPDGLPVPVSVVSAPSAPLGGPVTVSGVFFAEGDYAISVDGSQPYTITAIPIPRITGVTPPQAGESTSQSITITGTDFPVPPTVTVTDPDGNPVSVSVDASSATAITISGVFYPPGSYTVRVGISAPFSVQALTPIPVITSVGPPPQSGLEEEQQVQIAGRWFPDSPTVTILGPDGEPIDVSIVSASPNLIVVSGVFPEEGTYTVTVNNSAPATFDALAVPPPTIMAVTPPQSGITTPQDLTILGAWFPDDPDVTVIDPNGQVVPVSVYSYGRTQIDIGGVFMPEGIYTFQVNDSNIFSVQALPPPPPPPPPVITRVTQPQAGQATSQMMTITGTNFPDNAVVTVTGPDGTDIPVTIVSGSATSITVSGIFFADGIYTVRVDDSDPYLVESLPPIPLPPPFISHPIRRLRQFVLPTSPDHRRMFISRLELLMRTGIGLSRDKGSDPQVMMQLSRDGGKTWSAERWRSAGETADYLRRVRWLREGHYRDGVIRFVMSDPVDWQLLSLSGDLTEGSN